MLAPVRALNLTLNGLLLDTAYQLFVLLLCFMLVQAVALLTCGCDT